MNTNYLLLMDRQEVFYKAVYSVMLFVRINTKLPQIVATILLDHFRFKSHIKVFPPNDPNVDLRMRNELLFRTDCIRKITHIN